VWNDSPLVRAATRGCVLVIDEADKAPTHILTVLKSLVADGQLLLSDGRRLTSSRFLTTNADSSVDSTSNGSNDIATHPDFTVFVLANRAGFPFHGNVFFPEIGDCFSSHVISNPDLDSEIHLLQSYAPTGSIPLQVLEHTTRPPSSQLKFESS